MNATTVSKASLRVNGRSLELQVDPAMPLLWALRDELGLKGTKPGCLQGVCGACTVHVDGVPTRSCQLPLSDAAGRAVTTIEGLPPAMHERLVQAWSAQQALQCGYCQPGQAMSAAALLTRQPAPDVAEVRTTLAGHLCRCGAGPRVVQAVQAALTRSKPADLPPVAAGARP
jgi:aerobic-type carbon monoxide dehydrogenase small subunit (CoxS/CutS family)